MKMSDKSYLKNFYLKSWTKSLDFIYWNVLKRSPRARRQISRALRVWMENSGQITFYKGSFAPLCLSMATDVPMYYVSPNWMFILLALVPRGGSFTKVRAARRNFGKLHRYCCYAIKNFFFNFVQEFLFYHFKGFP